MNNTEAMLMAMALERERLVTECIAQGRIEQALAEQPTRAEPAGRGGVLKRARAIAGGVRRRCRRWLALPWDEHTPRDSTAVACQRLATTRKEGPMGGYAVPTRVALLVLAALLPLPLAETASPVVAKNRSRTITRTFRNDAGIYVNNSQLSPVSASLYPSPIRVSGLKGTIRDVNLTLAGVTTGNPDDLEALLVGPRGQTAVVMANVGGSADVINLTLRLDDEADASLPDGPTLQSGAFRPTNATGSEIAFIAPAPSASASSALSVFDGSNPNGTWRLFVQDENGPIAPIQIGRGWELEISTKVKAKKKQQ